MNRTAVQNQRSRQAVRRRVAELAPRAVEPAPRWWAAAAEPLTRCGDCGRYFDQICVCGASGRSFVVRGRAPWLPRTLGRSTHRVLFVCASGRCRAPMAAAILSELATRRGLPVAARAAFLAGSAAGAPHPHAVAALAELGIALPAAAAEPLTRWSVLWAGAVVALTDAHADAVIDQEPEAVGKVLMLGELDALGDIAHPEEDSLDAFRRCRDALYVAVEGLVDRLPVSAHRAPADAPAP